MSGSVTEREIINHIHTDIVSKFESITTVGPYTTLYWDGDKKDNEVQQQLTIEIRGQTFVILVREKRKS